MILDNLSDKVLGQNEHFIYLQQVLLFFDAPGMLKC
jgi:hypothetical protein